MYKNSVIRDYLNFEDLILKLNYSIHTPSIGLLGLAIVRASNRDKSKKWLVRYLDRYFGKIRRARRTKNGN